MFSVPHLIIIFVVVLIVFGPEKLPDLARNLGKIMGEFRRATGDLRSTFDEHMREIEREASMRAAAAAGTGTTIAPTEQNTHWAAQTCERYWDGDRGCAARVDGGACGFVDGRECGGRNDWGDTSRRADDDTRIPPTAKMREASANASAANAGATQAEVTTGRVDTEPEGAGESAEADHSKGSDGGSRPA